MSSVVATLETLQLLDYICIAATAAVCYDYTLTFSREVELIWMKSWSLMSTLFVVARYVGLALAILLGLGSGNGIFYMSELVSATMFQILLWTRLFYTVVVDVIMILRVSVMFNQPKRLRLILSFLYSLVTVNSIVFSIAWEGPHSGLVVTPEPVIGGTFCNVQPGRSEIPTVYDGIPRGVFDILLLVLAIYRFAINAIETRRMMGRQKVNKYMTLLLEHSIVYFFLNFSYEALAMGVLLSPSQVLYSLLVALYANSVPFMIYPRLVLSMRGYREASNGLYVGNEGSGYPHSHGHSKSSSVPVADTGEYELLEGMSWVISPGALQNKRGQNH
ncbi:hypothetical protein HD554DRAFT_1771359 [Boletus coccyginus]|nr:hypothetical protein HD554DRAFT_1771359 [Boletus coccyginus]